MIDDRDGFVAIIAANAQGAYLATVHGEQPYLRQVTVIKGEGPTMWVATSSTGRKVTHVQANPRVALAFADPDGRRIATVFGRAELVDSNAEKQLVWQWSPVDLSRMFPRGPEEEPFCVLRIVPDLIEWREGPDQPMRSYSPS
jgi:general stress protein 26